MRKPAAHISSLSIACLILAGFLVSGCASGRARPAAGYTPAVGERAAKTAVAMIGRPYKYSGDSPAGFDCSGLVRYSYLAAGFDAPHGTKALMNATRPVGLGKAREGDLLFFNVKGKRYSHVGIYLGGGLFVHAPSSGRKVRKDSLRDRYWKKSFLEARGFR
jgi:cell wall-associated NlpC family hydrolase